MPTIPRGLRPAALAIVLLCPCSPAGFAQVGEGFVDGAAAVAWDKWQRVMDALIDQDAEAAELAFADLNGDQPTALRIALLADRSLRGRRAGGLLLLEQEFESDTLEPNGRAIAELMLEGREQMNQADDGWYFSSIGQFPVANANFKALLAADPDPVALLEFADRVPRRQRILVQLADNPIMGETVAAILALLRVGEQRIKADPIRIKQNIQRLGGAPRAFENGVSALKDSGEYAIPFLLQALRDSSQRHLHRAILRTLPQIGRAGLNPLVMALRMNDQAVVQYVIGALGQIGYAQAAPYLLKLRDDAQTPPEIRSATESALDSLAGRGVRLLPGESAAEAFFRLAEAYYANAPSLAADTRLETANVWYWQDELPENVEVPTTIFNEIMTMRCCEEALLLNPGLKPALALWLAADFRREAQLPEGATDFTRPENDPSAVYFARSAGAGYCQLALARAIDDRDPAVALGVIEALRSTAGGASLIGMGQGRQPLAEALSFPDRMVRIRAAFALGAALPRESFHNSQNLMPVLNEALTLHGGSKNALVVDPDADSANEMMATLRAAGYQTVSDAGLFPALEKVRTQTAGVDVILIASDIREPDLQTALQSLRGEFRFAATPLLIVRKPADREVVGALARGDHSVEQIVPGADPEALAEAIEAVSKAVGATPITPEVGLALAFEAAEVLRGLGASNSPIADLGQAEISLLSAFESENPELRVAIADVLSLLGGENAQNAIAFIALNETTAVDLRVAMFSALADSGKRFGNLLDAEQTQQLIRVVEADANMTIRTAAAQALGALNLPSDPASAIIRGQSRG